MATPIYDILAGAAVTIAIRPLPPCSASYHVGGTGRHPARGGSPLLGAEICIRADKLAASVGRSREALRVGLFHLGFNIVSVSLGIGLLTAFARRTSDDPAQQIASAPIAPASSVPLHSFASPT